MTEFSYSCRPYGEDHKLGIVDGDTLDIEIDLGFHQFNVTRVRLSGVDTAEIYGISKHSQQYRKGMDHKRFVKQWISEGIDAMGMGEDADAYDRKWPFEFISTEYDRTDVYGRSVGVIKRKADNEKLNVALIDQFPEVHSDY